MSIVRSLSCITLLSALLSALLAASGCATSSMLAWQQVDAALGPFGTEVHTVRPGPPTEERLQVTLVALAADDAPPPSVDPPPPVYGPPSGVDLPADEGVAEPAPPGPREPVGPSLASLPLRLVCATSERADKDLRGGYVQPLSHLLYVPVFFASALTLIPAVLAIDAAAEAVGVEDKERGDLLPLAVFGAGTGVFVDVLVGAVIAYTPPKARLPKGLVDASWVPGAATCVDVSLSYAGRSFPVLPDGSLEPWDEADLVHTLVHQPGNLVVAQPGAWAGLPLPYDARCALARDRGYGQPAGCPDIPTALTSSVQLPARAYAVR